MIFHPNKFPYTVKAQRLARHLFTLCLILFTSLIISCETIYDKEENCENIYYIKYVYDMNMDYADAFSTKVNSVDLFVFDSKNGEFIKKISEEGESLSQENYLMRVNLEPGNYDFVAWCGLANNNDDFIIPSSIKKIEDLNCILSRDYTTEGIAIQNRNLSSLFHGKIEAVLPNDYMSHTYVMPLVKNTNNINLSVQEINGGSLDLNRFTIRMEAQNGYMGFDNNLLDDEFIEFSPYRKVWGSASITNTKADDIEDEEEIRHDIVLAELSTSRLIAEHNPTLDVIDNNSGTTIYSIPLVKWALMLKSQQYVKMKDQEYLDREDEFNIILYINSDGQVTPDYYMAVSVMINGWRMVINGNTDLGS